MIVYKSRRILPRWEGDTLTLSEAARRFAREKETEATRETYLRRLDQFLAYLIDCDRPNAVDSFNEENVRGFVGYLRDEAGIGANSIRSILSALSSFAKWAMTEKHPKRRGHLLESNPVEHIKRPKHVPPPEKWLTLDQLHVLLAAVKDDRERLALSALADQPLRASEWCRANVADLYQEGDTVGVQVRVKGGAYRRKALSPQFTEVLLKHLREREARPGDPILVNIHGKRWSRQGLSNLIDRIAQRAGLGVPVRAHMIRHTIASRAAFNGSSVYEIAEMLNHRSLQTAQRYIHGVRGDVALDKVRGEVWRG